jgi:ketosteroid isomerase-like protein
MHPAPHDGTDDATDVVSRYLHAWRTGDLTTVLDSYHPELVLEWPGSHPLAGRHVGLAPALDALAALQARTVRVVVSIGSVIQQPGEWVAVDITERWSCPDPVAVSRSLWLRVADGRIVECVVEETDQELVDRLLR